jgi:HEXXH motif-containing protein
VDSRLASPWTDRAPYQRRYEKSACALVAVARVLERERPLGGREEEFLELWRFLEAAPPPAFSRVWTAPASHYWAVVAYQLVGKVLSPRHPAQDAEAYAAAIGASEPRDALAHHLDELKRLALAVAVAAGVDCWFRRPLRARLPFPIVGVGLVVDGAGEIELHGLADAALVVEHAGDRLRLGLRDALPRREGADAAPPGDRLRVAPCALARCDGYELQLDPTAFRLPGVTIAEPLRELPLAFQAGQVPIVEAALERIRRRQPETFQQMREVLRVVAFKPRALGDFSNVSQSDLPGAFVCSTTADPWVLADSMIHEFHHNRLFFLQEGSPLFAGAGDGVPDTGEYYSPWREDLRPLQGILHGAYVYLPVFWFWAAALRDDDLAGGRLRYARDQVARIPCQCAIAVDQLRHHGQLTDAGTELLDILARETERAANASAELGVTTEVPATIALDDGNFPSEEAGDDGKGLTVGEAIAAHVARFDTRGQVRLREVLGASRRA